MLAAELERAFLASRTRYNGPRLVHFRVNGIDVATTEETTRSVPGSYLDWLVANCEEDVVQGRPICLKASPQFFARMLRRHSIARERAKRCPRQQCLQKGRPKRRALDPPPFTNRRLHAPTDRPLQICQVTTPLPSDAALHVTVDIAVRSILESFRILSRPSTAYFDRLIVILTVGRTFGGMPVIWPYIIYLLDSYSRTVRDLIFVQNAEIQEMDADLLESLHETVHLSSEIQHRIKVQLRLKGHTCTYTDMKLDLNNFFQWRLARLRDKGIRSLDDACTVRCLILHT